MMETFEVKIDFLPDSQNPSRVFRAMAGLLDSFNRFDRDVLSELAFPVTSELLLHDIQTGSLKSILSWILRLPDKEALREGDWNKLIGRMLDDCRIFLLKKLEQSPKIKGIAQLEEIQKGLAQIAEQIPHELLHVVRPISLPRILITIQSIEASTRMLFDGDSVEYRSMFGITNISTELEIDPNLEEQLLVASPAQHPMRVLLPVKKPDMIGDSQWDLYMGSKVVRAKILDSKWLNQFHNRVTDLKPGDALDALLEITLLKSYEGEVVASRYNVIEVYGVVPISRWKQDEFSIDGIDDS